MRIFVTGATGWVGSAVIRDLIAAGHDVIGLARSNQKAEPLARIGARIVEASLDDHDRLRESVAAVDAVVHTAFNHDFSRFLENAAQDQRTIEVLGEAIGSSGKPILVTSGLSGLPLGASEASVPNPASPRKSEAAARALSNAGLRAATIRLAPSVHGLGDHGFVPIIIRLARQTGVSAYPEEIENFWSGVRRHDAAKVYRLALEQGVTESVYHAVADEAVPFRAVAEVVGHRLGLPVESRPREHFGWFANMACSNMAVSSALTREILRWEPEGPDLLTDLDQPGYYLD